MIGIRLDRSPVRLSIWGALIVGSFFLNKVVQDSGWSGWYVAGAWASYYIGNTLILGTSLRSKLIRWLGGKRALAVYEVVLGVMFVNVALSLGTLPLAQAGSFHVPTGVAMTVSLFLFVVGFGSKVWATWLTGLDVYYYRDLFLRKQIGSHITSGPYRWFKNPMYGIGNLHLYAAAFFLGSLEGLAWALACHASIYLFYYLIERPFVIKAYLK